MESNQPVFEMKNISKSFEKPSGDQLTVLEGINLTLKSGEIVCLLGRSGAGKSTLLRIASGLITPSSGEVLYQGQCLEGPEEGIALVFQSFALYPWLNVIDNVEIGLDALGLDDEETRKRALAAIDRIGLDGFQSAYPRELSGGMRQRVGFARALVTDPVFLLMDEPFSSLDVLTADTLRSDFLDLWVEGDLTIKSVLLITHNIEEAVLMSDRIIVLSSNPGKVAAEIPVSLERPRNRLDKNFRDIVDDVYTILTSRAMESLETQSKASGGLAQLLPKVQINTLRGLMEALTEPPFNGSAQMADIVTELSYTVSDFFPAAEALHLLRFAELKEDTIKLTPAGHTFVESDMDEQKKLFKEHLIRYIPLAAHIKSVLDRREDHIAPLVRFAPELEDHLTKKDAQNTLKTIINWGRYAELFSYDERAKAFRGDPTLD